MEAKFSWEDLLVTIGDRRAIPIIGRDLLRIEDKGGEPVLLEQLLAETLGEIAGILPGPLHWRIGTRGSG